MKTIIQALETASDWTGTGTATDKDWPHLSANWQSAQVQFSLPVIGNAMAATVSVDVTDKEFITIFIAGNSQTSTAPETTDYALKVSIEGSPGNVEYYVPLSKVGQPFIIKNSFTAITKVEFISLKTDTQFFCHNMIAYTDELPIDIYKGLADSLRRYNQAERVLIGTITGTAGDTTLSIPASKRIEHGSVIVINSKQYQIKTGTPETDSYTLENTFTGSSLSDTVSSEPVYLEMAVVYGIGERPLVVPSIGLSGGFDSEIVAEVESTSIDSDTHIVSSDTKRYFFRGDTSKITIDIECLGRHPKDVEALIRIVKKAINKRSLVWINGRKHELNIDTHITQQNPELGDIFLPRSVMQISIEYLEDTWEEETLSEAILAPTYTVTITTPT